MDEFVKVRARARSLRVRLTWSTSRAGIAWSHRGRLLLGRCCTDEEGPLAEGDIEATRYLPVAGQQFDIRTGEVGVW